MCLTDWWTIAIRLGVGGLRVRDSVYRRMPSITIDEWRDLGRCARQLQASADALARSTWQGSPAILVNLAQVHEVIAALYNRVEPFAVQPWRRKRADMPPQGTKGESPSESSSEPLKTAQ